MSKQLTFSLYLYAKWHIAKRPALEARKIALCGIVSEPWPRLSKRQSSRTITKRIEESDASLCKRCIASWRTRSEWAREHGSTEREGA